MASPFDPFRWYWDVLDTLHGTQVYSTQAERYVVTSDPNYTAWLAKDGGNTPAPINTHAQLCKMLDDLCRSYYIPTIISLGVISADVALTNPPGVSYSYTDNGSVAHKIIMPSAMSPRSVPIGQKVLFRSGAGTNLVSANIVANDGTTVLTTHAANTAVTLMLVSNTTVNGIWIVLQEGAVSNYGTVTAGDFAQWVSPTQQTSLSPANAMNVLGAAPVASPTFTGDPKAPTPAAADNDTSIATTAHVHAAIAADLAALSTFRATLSANQTGIVQNTFTKVAFNTAGVNVGSHFNTTNNRWTPPAGRVLIGAGLNMTCGTSANVYAAIYKNGSAAAYFVGNSGSTTIGWADVQHVDICNGTDFYECWTLHNFAGTGTVNAAAAETRFWGMRL